MEVKVIVYVFLRLILTFKKRQITLIVITFIAENFYEKAIERVSSTCSHYRNNSDINLNSFQNLSIN